MASTMVKYDDGVSFGAVAHCFPVRNLRRNIDNGGAWLVEQRVEQRRRFKAFLCAKPKDYAQIKAERKKNEKVTSPESDKEEDEDIKILDGFFLMRHCCVDDPVDLCTVNISGQGLLDCREEDFALFENVAFINAAENLLMPESFKNFRALRELDLSLNGLRSIKLNSSDLPNLQVLNVSYNNLSPEDVRALSNLQNLRILHISGNGLTTLPNDLLQSYSEENRESNIGFSKLEILSLDENRFATSEVFAALATLPNLKYLNLSKNVLKRVPLLAPTKNNSYTVADELLDADSAVNSPRSNRSKKSRSKSSGRLKSARKEQASEVDSYKEIDSYGAAEASHDFSTLVNQPQMGSFLPPAASNPDNITEITTVLNANFFEGDNHKSISNLSPTFPASQSSASSLPLAVSVHMPHIPEGSVPLTNISLLDNSNEEKTTDNSNAVIDDNKTSEIKKLTTNDNTSLELSRLEAADKEFNNSKINSAAENIISSQINDNQNLVLRLSGEELQERFAKDVTENENNNNNDTSAIADAANISSETKVLENFSVTDIDSENQQQIVMDYSIGEMQFEELDLNAIEQKIKEEKALEEGYVETPRESARFPTNPPFSHLEKLDLSYNQIADEKSLLPVAAWPSLLDLIIHNNPLTTEHSGDPILLTPFLHERLGISIHRKKEIPVKPSLDIPRKDERKVKVHVPAIPKRSADELLAILLPLPSIPRSPLLPESSEQVFKTSCIDENCDITAVETNTGGTQNSEESEAASFFMTQVEERYAKSNQEKNPFPNSPKLDDVTEKKSKKKRKTKMEKKYQGYEELLDADDTAQIEEDIPQPADIQGNVRALHYMLGHPLIFRDPEVHLDKKQKQFKPLLRHAPLESPTLKTNQEKIDEVLSKMKNRQQIVEVPLSEVIRHREKYKQCFGDADRLLSQVQRKYNEVRETSMKEARKLTVTMENVADMARSYPSSYGQKKTRLAQHH